MTPTPKMVEAWKSIKKVPQRTPDDCERCCFAMMLGVEYEDIPDFMGIYNETKIDRRRAWLMEKGYCFLTLEPVNLHTLPPIVCMAGVESPTEHPDGHAVIGVVNKGKFQVLYDPSPHKSECTPEPFELNYFVPIYPPGISADPVVLVEADWQANLEKYLDDYEVSGSSPYDVSRPLSETERKEIKEDIVGFLECYGYDKTLSGQVVLVSELEKLAESLNKGSPLENDRNYTAGLKFAANRIQDLIKEGR